jgi:multiple antibiotic resistance protein
MHEYTEYTKLLIALLAIVNPLGAVPIFVALTANNTEAERKRIARMVVIAVLAILGVTMLFGDRLLAFFGITINSFSVGGGILLLLMAISMLHANVSLVRQTPAEAREGEAKDDVAVVPIAMPLLAGPGAISTVILHAHRDTGVAHYTAMGLDILLIGALIWIVLQMVPWISRHVSQTGINIFTRIMGLILAAIAIEFIGAGLKGMFPALAAAPT